ncbi:MAG: (5-formylfuran-3-yl)methyl phosphate synthase [Pirellulales bacterium]
MMQLLVSVRDEAEARDACAAGAALIDLKEPIAGPLGPVHVSSWPAIRAAVGDGAPLSVALGELTDPHLLDRVSRLSGFDFAKIGLAGLADAPDWPQRLADVWRRIPATTRKVAVAYADYGRCAAPPPEQILDAAPAGCSALLIDTATKGPGESLFDHLTAGRLRVLIEAARQRRWTVVLAGSLRLERLDDAAALAPDYVAVRGAVCRGARDGRLDPQLVRDWVRAVRERAPSCASSPPPSTINRSRHACPNS